MADRRHHVGRPGRHPAAAVVGAALGVWVLGAVCAPARAESPQSHHARPDAYQAPAGLPGGLSGAPAASKPAAPAAVARPGYDPNDPEARRTALGLKAPAAASGPAEEFVPTGETQKVKLWSTRDPPNQRGVFAFLGNRIGDPIQAIFPKPLEEKDQFGMQLCRDTPGMSGFLDCADDSLRTLIDGRWQQRYRGVDVSFLNFKYMGEKLVGFDLGFPAQSFKALSEVLQKQYGPPTADQEFDWKNRLGYIMDVRMMTWNTPHGPMVLRSRGVSQDAGTLSLMEPKAEARYSDIRYRQMNLPGPPMPPQQPRELGEGIPVEAIPSGPQPPRPKPVQAKPVAKPAEPLRATPPPKSN